MSCPRSIRVAAYQLGTLAADRMAIFVLTAPHLVGVIGRTFQPT